MSGDLRRRTARILALALAGGVAAWITSFADPARAAVPDQGAAPRRPAGVEPIAESTDPSAAPAEEPSDLLAPVRDEARRRAGELARGDGLRAAVELAESGDAPLALALVEALLDGERGGSLRGIDRAGLEAARGWLEFRVTPALAELDAPLGPQAAARFEAARAAFGRARSEAGPGPVRRRAVTSLATLELYEAERALRAFLTELQAGPGAAPGADEPPADPLERIGLLRAMFVEARDLFVERLRLGSEAVDPRANLEWTMRRLRELEELERQLEQQQEEPQEQPSDPGEEGDERQPQDGEQGDEQQPGEPGDQQQDDPQAGDEQDQESGRQEESQDGTDEQDGADEQDGPEPQTGDEQGEGETPAGEVAESPQLSQEEITALLDRLAELEAQAEARRAQMRRRGRAAVERDW